MRAPFLVVFVSCVGMEARLKYWLGKDIENRFFFFSTFKGTFEMTCAMWHTQKLKIMGSNTTNRSGVFIVFFCVF